MGCAARLFVDKDMAARWICYDCGKEVLGKEFLKAHARCVRYDEDGQEYLRVDFECDAVEWR